MPKEIEHIAKKVHSPLGKWILRKVFSIDIDDMVSKRRVSLAVMDATSKQKAQFDETIATRDAINTSLRHHLDEARAQLSSTEKERDRLKKDHKKLKSEHEAKLNEIEALDGEKRSMQSLMSDLTSQIKDLKKAAKQNESELSAANAKLETLRAEIAEKDHQIQDHAVSLSQAESSSAQKIEGLTAQVEIYRKRLEDVINDKDRCENEYVSRIKDLQEQITSLQTASRKADDNEEDLSKEIKELTQSLSACESALQEKTETIEGQKAEIMRLQAKLDALTTQHDEDIKRLQDLLREKDNKISQQAGSIKELEETLSEHQQEDRIHPMEEGSVNEQPAPAQIPYWPQRPHVSLAWGMFESNEDATPRDMPTIVEDGSVESVRSIESVINCETGEQINANAYFDRPKEEIALMSRKLEIISKSGDAPLFVCAKCHQPVRISKITHSKGETLFFAHCHREKPCEWRTKNETAAKPVFFVDESYIRLAEAEKSRYEQLKELIYKTLKIQQEKGFDINEVKIDKKIQGESSRLYRTFDVYVKWRNTDIVFKLQRSTDYLQDLVGLDEFCKQKKIFIIWVFGSDSATNYNYLLKNNYQNTLFDNRSCVFILDKEAEQACIDKKVLTLKCNWLIDGKHWYHTLERTQSNGVLVTLNDLSFDNTETYKPYYQQMLITRSIGSESIELKPGVYKYCEGSLWGIYNKNKEIKSECKYSEIYLDEDANIVAVTADYLDKRKGRLSDEGVEIPSQRKRLAPGVYLLTIFELYCLADKDDKPFTSMYKSIEEWCNDRLVIKSGDGYGIMDYQGQIIAKPEYREFNILNSRTAQVTDFWGTYKINYLNDIIPDETIDLPDGYRKVRHLNKWGIYNPEGQLIIDYIYQEIATFRKRFIGINENDVVKLNNSPRYDYRLPFRATYKGPWKSGCIFDCHGVEMKMPSKGKSFVDLIVGKEYVVYLTNAQLKGTQSICAVAIADDKTISKKFDHIDLDSDFSMGEQLEGTITKKKAPNRLYITFKDGRQTYISKSRITQSGLNPEDYPVGATIEIEKIDFDPYYETTKWKVIK